MPEPIIAAATISAAIPAAVELIKMLTAKGRKDPEQLRELASAANTQILEFQGKLGEVQARIIDLQAENATLKDKVAELKKKADREKDLVRGEGVYFRIRADGSGLEETPCCQYCWDNDGKFVRMATYEGGRYSCPACLSHKRTVFQPPEHIAKERKSAQRRLARRSVEGS